MALTRTALREKGITEKEILDYIMEEHGNVIEATKEKAKEAADKTVDKLQVTIDTLQSKLDSIPEPTADGDDWKDKHDKLKAKYDTDILAKQTEYDNLKTSIETEKQEKAIDEKLTRNLIKANCDPKLIKAVKAEIDKSKLVDDGDSFKDFEKIIEPVKTGEYNFAFTTVEQKAFDPAKTQPSSDGKVQGNTNSIMNNIIRGKGV